MYLQLIQNQDPRIQECKQRHPQALITRSFDNNVTLVSHIKSGNNPNLDWEIVFPESVISLVIKRRHQVLNHPCNNRVRDVI